MIVVVYDVVPVVMRLTSNIGEGDMVAKDVGGSGPPLEYLVCHHIGCRSQPEEVLVIVRNDNFER